MAATKSLKEQGNDAFKLNDLAAALDLYSRATAEDETDAAPPNNEAAVHLKLKQYAQAKACCDVALARDTDNVKAYVRRAQANAGLEEYGRAVRDYRTALRLQPSHTTAADELDALLRLRRREAKAAASDVRLAEWLALFRLNLAARKNGKKPLRRNGAAELLEAERLDREPETRRLRRAFMRGFEREVGIRTDDEDSGSESDDEVADDDEDEEEEEEDDGSDAEWETDDEVGGEADPDGMDHDP